MKIYLTHTSLLFLAILLFPVTYAAAQQYRTETAASFFQVQAPAKMIKGVSETVTVNLDLKQGTVAVKVPVKTFRFENNFVSDSLNHVIRDRFNAYYMESDRFPLITYTGKLQKTGTQDLDKKSSMQFRTEGMLVLHGIERQVTATGSMSLISGEAIVHADITIQPAAWGIRIPSYIGDLYFREVKIEITGTLKNMGKSPKRK